MKRKILLVDDEVAILLTLKTILEMNGFHVETASSAEEGVNKIRNGEYSMVITDMRMESEQAGFDVIRAARSQAYDPATAILTAFPTLSQEWQQEGADQLLVKPVGTDNLLRQLEALLVQHEDAKAQGKSRKPSSKATPISEPRAKQTAARRIS